MIISYLEKLLKITTTECKTFSNNAHIPRRVYQGSAGHDFFTAETKVLKLWSRVLMKLDLTVAISEGYYGWTVGRSGLANTHGIIVHDVTIDSDYRGVVSVVLFNLSNEECLVEVGNRIGQSITERCFMPKLVELSKFTEEKTERGEKGFGSSGV